MYTLRRAVIVILVLGAQGWTQSPGPSENARELFYAPQNKPSKPKAGPRLQSSQQQPPTPTSSPKEPERATPPPAANPTIPSQTVGDVAAVSSLPLALQYLVLKKTADGSYSPVSLDSTFRSGDRIRVTVKVNDSAYLYVVHHGSSGKAAVLFPSAEINDGDNRVDAYELRNVPVDGGWTFEDPPGIERLSIFASTEPIEDMDNLIYSFDQKGTRPATDKRPTLVVGQTIPSIDELAINTLSQQLTLSRDLVFKKDEAENAMYVANVTGAAKGRVMADLELKHNSRD